MGSSVLGGERWLNSFMERQSETRSSIIPVQSANSQQRMGSNWNYKTELSALAVRLGYTVHEVPSLSKALVQEGQFKTITTATGSKHTLVKPNRLSVLGRSTMFHYVYEYLHFSYPKVDGSMLQDIGNSITNEDALCRLANHFGVTDLIKTKVDLSLPSSRPVISQSLCAVIGSVYQDQGPKLARNLVHEIITSQLTGNDLHEIVKLEHPRFMLNTLLKNRPKLVSRLVSESGRATHFPSFVVGVFSGKTCLGEGTGTSLRRAEQEAMRTALRIYFEKELSAAPLPSDHEEFMTEEELKQVIECAV